MVQLTGEKMEPLDNIYHSTQVEVAAAIENDEEVELATAVQRIVAWIINRVIEVVLMIPAFGLIIALVLKSSGGDGGRPDRVDVAARRDDQEQRAHRRRRRRGRRRAADARGPALAAGAAADSGDAGACESVASNAPYSAERM